jgi:penicillin-binding protein 2
VMTARLTNGGYAVSPRLLREANAPDGKSKPFAKLKTLPEHLRHVLAGMEAVTNSQRGTAYGARIVDPEMAMGGKTGTAQVKRITQAERDAGNKKADDVPWHLRHHALFVGYAPVANPRYACAVIVEHGGGGSKAAAPVARDVLIETQKRDPSATPPRQVAGMTSPTVLARETR